MGRKCGHRITISRGPDRKQARGGPIAPRGATMVLTHPRKFRQRSIFGRGVAFVPTASCANRWPISPGGPIEGAEGRGEPRHPDGEGRARASGGRRGGRSGAISPTFRASCLRHDGRSAGACGPACARGRVHGRRPGGRAWACVGVRAMRAGVRAWAWGVPATAGTRAYVRVRGRVRRQPSPEPPIPECAAEGRPTEPRSPSVAGPLPQNSGGDFENCRATKIQGAISIHFGRPFGS